MTTTPTPTVSLTITLTSSPTLAFSPTPTTPTLTTTPTPIPSPSATARPCPCSIWSTTTTPGIPAQNDPYPVELGIKFRTDLPGYITGLRFYKGPTNSGPHIGNLWTSTGTLLASATFTNETPSGWQEVSFAQPIPINPNTTYIASYHTNVGYYAVDQNYFTTSVDATPLHALADGLDGGNGVYAYSSTSTFPTSSYLASNYWVDVIFTTTLPPSPTPTFTPSPTSSPTPAALPTPTT